MFLHFLPLSLSLFLAFALLAGTTADAVILGSVFKEILADPGVFTETLALHGGTSHSICSKLECGSACLQQSTLSSTCLAFHYDSGTKACSCGKLLAFGDWNNGTKIQLYVAKPCDWLAPPGM